MVPRVVGSSPIFHPPIREKVYFRIWVSERKIKIIQMVNVAQLVRALDCGSKGRGFESHLSPHLLKGCSFIDEQPFFCLRALIEPGFIHQ